ncbi:hypothetical protein HPB48_019415 [Haemaphysalis longicornis]|uniref:ABC transporter domain-containing protein n=1 Tax=Haemaphysalis longicornis TaxID=44386 RepID=A0A9J6GKS5_HAELO|nr:hypothetical protein HPB48_019415 [Haemaphysalis longicornis]
MLGKCFRIAMFLIDAIIFYVILSRKLSGPRFAINQPVRGSEETQVDPDVAKEKSLVEGICHSGTFENYSLVARNVHKYYGDVFAVRHINLALRKSECLGLLGVNGAGKTTTFQALAGLSSCSLGEVHSANLTLASDLRKVKYGQTLL